MKKSYSILLYDACVKTVTTSGTGNAVTAISKSGTTVTATKGYMVSGISASGTGNALTALSLSSGKLTYTKGYVISSIASTGSGNVLTGMSLSSGKLTYTKGRSANIYDLGMCSASFSNKTIAANGTLDVTGTATPDNGWMFSFAIGGILSGSYNIVCTSWSCNATAGQTASFTYHIYVKNLSSSSVTFGGVFEFAQAKYGT